MVFNNLNQNMDNFYVYIQMQNITCHNKFMELMKKKFV